MKLRLFASLLLVIFVSWVSAQERPYYVSFDSSKQLSEYLSYQKHDPLVSAHRGGPMEDFPENAIATFENALWYAPCILECDVRESSDGVLLLLHDDELERTTTGTGSVKQTKWQDLQKLYLKDPLGKVTSERIPSFREALKWAKGKAILSVDVKRGVAAEKIVEAIRAEQAEAYCIIIVYNLEDLKKYHKLAPELMISASGSNLPAVKRVFRSDMDPKKLVVFVGVSEPEAEVYEFLHERGVRAILGTMHNLDQKAARRGIAVYLGLIARGADILATDNVPLAARAVRVWKETQDKK